MRSAGEADRETGGRRPEPHSHRVPPPASDSEDDSVSEAEMEEEGGAGGGGETEECGERAVDPEMQARLEALLEAAGIGKMSGEGKHLADPEVLRRLTSSVSCALDEAAAALTRMRSDQPPAHHHDKQATTCGSTATGTVGSTATTTTDTAPSLAEACSDGDVGTVRKLLTEGRSVHETTEEGESLLSLACSAGYYELAQVLLAMHASVEDRGIKGDCTPLMEAASAGHVEIVNLLIAHGADANAQSGSGNTPLMYACAGGHEAAVRALLEAGANVEDHNENGHTPLMEAASAGHVGVARILLEHGAGINTHSNEFKESALTLACYKGHLDMVRFLLGAGADREHKTDEMHTALMEASMDGHVEVARLLLDSGAQVNMPTDSFESPLTLAACGGHVELAMLLLERGANIEEVNDEGYTPLMEAAREGHEEMVALLLGQGAAINAQTDETQETALTLACCGGFLDVAEFLVKAGADIELGASTPLMEASQEGHIDLVRYLLSAGADVHTQTQTGDTALTYACENGHTDVAAHLLRYGADLEHESEGGRTPLMKACRAGHLCTVQFLVGKGADVNRVTANGDHTPLSLACAGGHAEVVKFLLACDADPFRKLKDNSTTLIEAAKGGHTVVVQLLLDYPHSVMMGRGEEGGGLTAAQAAQLGLAHVPGPVTGGVRALVPLTDVHTAVTPPPADVAFKALCEGARKKMATTAPPAAAPPPAAAFPAPPAAPLKHKCGVRKATRSTGQPPDHHLPPPPDIDQQLFEEPSGETASPGADPPTPIPAPTGPPTLVTSALNALHLQPFCAQGVTTPPFIPKQPARPPNVNQSQAAENPPVQATTEPQLEQASRQGKAKAATNPLYTQVQNEAYQLGLVHYLTESDAEARELGAVLTYLQREVPSLVALRPAQLRALVLQVMQQKSHEILQCKSDMRDRSSVGSECSPGDERQARRLLAAAAQEALSFMRSARGEVGSESGSPVCRGSGSPGAEAAPPPWRVPVDGDTDETEPGPPAPFNTPHLPAHNPNLNVPPPTTSTVAVQATPTAAAPAPAAPPGKRDASTTPANTSTPPPLKKKGRFAQQRHAHKSEPAPGYPQQPPAPAPAAYSAMDVDGETDSNRDTALTLACAGGHDELVELLLSRGADIEHRDKKGFTPLILAATAGHEKIVELLLDRGADIEAQSERTKDTPLSLACSGGRYEVVELVLARGANKEHRNVSDYTPLSLAASGGYVNIIRLLLHHQAEINSRTGSKLGISPLMLAAMNGHVAAVRLLLDCGSDINAQIETNRNTALTLACFQGRHEVVSLLLDRKANVEHRAKTGLTPLMEAASGGYVEVGRVLLDKGADVNAPPVPSSRDTALTIAADKGHARFVELLLHRRAAVEVKNKKGNSPLWLAANGGHLSVVEMLHTAGADIDSQDNRKVSCLMAAFRKGHTKVVKWMVDWVTQFPSDQEMFRYTYTISDKELLEKCQECVRIIRAAKETQAARANQNADILLEELNKERCREQSKRQAAARRRERKKKKKLEKKEEQRKMQETDKSSVCSEKASGECSEEEEEPAETAGGKEEGDSGIDAVSQGSCSSTEVKPSPAPSAKSKKKKREPARAPSPAPVPAAPAPADTAATKLTDKTKAKPECKSECPSPSKPERRQEKENVAPESAARDRKPADRKDKWETETKTTSIKSSVCAGVARREDGWKEVVRKSSVQPTPASEPGCKKVCVAAHAISRVIGRAGSNINAIRSATGAHIEVDKQNKGQAERTVTIKGTAEATKQAATLIAAMIRDPDADISHLLPRAKPAPPASAAVPPAKTLKQPAPLSKVMATPAASRTTSGSRAPPTKQPAPTRAPPPHRTLPSAPAAAPSVEKRAPVSAPSPSAAPPPAPLPKPAPPRPAGTFAATVGDTRRASPAQMSPPSVPCSWTAGAGSGAEETPHTSHTPHTSALHINTQLQSGAHEYTLFEDFAAGRWGVTPTSDPPRPAHNPDPPVMQVDASKAPGYRGNSAAATCSPSPPLYRHTDSHTGIKCRPLAVQRPSAAPTSSAPAPPPVSVSAHNIGNGVSPIDMGPLRNGPVYPDTSRSAHSMMMSPQMGGYSGVDGVSHLQRQATPMQHHNSQLFAGGGATGLGTLLMSYQQTSQPQQPPMQHVYQSLLERGVSGVAGMSGWGAAEEEDRKPKPIGTERAWKLTAPHDWAQQQRYQAGELDGSAMSLMSLHYLQQPRNNWRNNQDQQDWSNKWGH